MRETPQPEQAFWGFRRIGNLLVGKILLAVGFVLALYAVTKPDRAILNTSLGVPSTGILLLIAGLYHRILLRREK